MPLTRQLLIAIVRGQTLKIIITCILLFALCFGTSFANDNRSGDWHSSIKHLGENGGLQKDVLHLLGEPSFSKNVVVHDSGNFVIGIRPMQCGNVSDGEEIEIWAYSVNGKGFYQFFFKAERLFCLRWYNANKPFGDINSPYRDRDAHR